MDDEGPGVDLVVEPVGLDLGGDVVEDLAGERDGEDEEDHLGSHDEEHAAVLDSELQHLG